ncbi:AAA family ATPase [Coleofasciculus sp. E1-EBD-02]|uniref:AAA family ATPase n=1 Tax=Coleofasciculus sp. E1-EBD-02 TaxID=3068481 RepID=UPI0032FBE897
MSSPSIPRNAYTDSPEQHPNLILGSLQLLFWMVFHPSAFRNHLKRIDPALDFHNNRRNPLLWQNPKFWKLLFQGYIILPILANLILALVLLVPRESLNEIILGVALDVTASVVFCVVFSLAFSLAFGVVFGVAAGVAFGVALNVMVNVAVSVESVAGSLEGVTFGVAFGVVFGVAAGVVENVAADVAVKVVTVVFGVAVSVAAGVALGMGVSINLWLPIVTYPFVILWNELLYRLDQQRPDTKSCVLRYHSAFWDEWQRLPLSGLDKHLVLVMENNPAEGQAALNYLNTSRHRWAAQAAQIELDARKLERRTNLGAIRKAYYSFASGNLEGSANAILDKFHSISADVDAALNQNSVYNQRIALENVTKALDLLVQELTKSSNQYAPRFRPIAIRWQQIVVEYVQILIAATELHQEIDDPYIFGVPLNEQVQLFMGRTSIGLRIEKLILDRRRPPLLLYGQRRMGKTSLLNNLGRLLPNSIIPMFVDLQGAPTSASDHAGFLYNLTKGMTNSAKRQAGLTLPPLTREALTDDPFTTFDEWLDDVEQTLDNNTALLALDEFEVLDKALTDGRFSETDVLGMLRHLIQHRPRFKVLLAGSHTIEEFQRWASYLINVQVVPISYLNEPEARQLIERPIPDFTLRYEPDAVERVLSLTRCHPCLVQLLCSEIVALKNEQEVSIRRLATVVDVEAAIPEALSSGSFFFADIERNQVDELGLAILRFLAAQGEGVSIGKAALSRKFPDRLNPTLTLLLQRELIEDSGGGYCFQVELIRRWFARDTGGVIS